MTATLDDALFVHASARAPERWPYVIDRLGADACLAACDARVVFVGHTHQPAMFHQLAEKPSQHFRPLANKAVPLTGRRRWAIVVGSVGQPRDQNPAAGWGLYEPDDHLYTQRRVAYDVDATVAKINAAGLPSWLGQRLTLGEVTMPVGRLVAGLEIDGYVLGEQLTAGGMGAIWRARHPDIALPLILKVPFFAPGDDVATIVGFEVEEMVMQRLEGPHVPKFFGAGDLAATPYLAMEFVAGQVLEERLREAPLSPDVVAVIGAQIARALDSIHRQRVVHLDLKPANIIMADRGAVLIDFGLARHEELPDLLGEESELPMGSAPYMAPEQVLGRRAVSPATDIFALGAILYELTTGDKPFGIPSSRAGMQRRLYHPPKPPRAVVGATPRWLQEVILRCLEIDPARRYPTAAQVRFDLLHPEQVAVTERAERRPDRGFVAGLKRVFGRGAGLPVGMRPGATRPIDSQRRADTAPMLMAAVDLAHGIDALADEVRTHLARVLAMAPDARLACVTVLKTSLAGLEIEVDDMGRPAYLGRLVALKDWAGSLDLPAERISFHVLEAIDVGGAILEYAARNDVDQIVMGARAASALRRHLGSVSAKVVAEARCSVMVVRVRQRVDGDVDDERPEELGDPTL